MKKFKELYSFTVNKEQLVEEQVKEKRGEEEVTVTHKVKKETPIKFFIKKPSRKELDEIDMIYSIFFNKCIEKGCLTRQMIAKKYGDIGGFLTDAESKEYSKLYFDFYNAQSELSRLETITDLSDAQKKKKQELVINIALYKRDLVNYENSRESLFRHTADEKAKNKAIYWMLLNLVYSLDMEDSDENAEPKQLFAGETQEEKEDSYDELDEKNDEIFKKVVSKSMPFIVLYYQGIIDTAESFDKLQESLKKEDDMVEKALSE
jgi:hypothetical protein